MQNRKKAFTLTEMLVVVIIIGVLAAVVLPKFNKIIETRKTTEAEEMMSAIRTEQERRCTLGKQYTMDPGQLSNILPNTTSPNYDYGFEPNGMLATSKGHYTYNLKMPSYADGRFCCDGEQCGNLNKDYLTCDDLTARPDFRLNAACTAEPYNPSEPPEPPTPPDPVECQGEPPSSVQNCTFADVGIARPGAGVQMCGKKHQEYECNSYTGQWVPQGWDTSACVHFPSRSQESKPCSELNASCTDGTAVRSLINTCGADGTVHTTPGAWDTSGCKRFVGLVWERLYDPGGGGSYAGDCSDLPEPPVGEACSTEGEEWSGFECPSGSNAVAVQLECKRQYASCI